MRIIIYIVVLIICAIDNLAREYGVMSIPCLILFQDGKEINRSVGLKSKSEIEGMLE